MMKKCDADMPAELDVAIATWKPEGIERIAKSALPIVDGVRYVISWQRHAEAPVPASLCHRKDVIVTRCEADGLSNNRNNALAHCSAPVILISDDDVTFRPEGLKAVITTFHDNPQIDIATFMYDGAEKTYPPNSTVLGRRLPKGFSVAAIEIAMRRSTSAILQFDSRFGLGAPVLQCCEDEKFLLDARRIGLNCRFFPYVIASHPHTSTGNRPITSAGTAKAMGCLIKGEYPVTFILRIPLKAWRLWRKGSSFLFVLRHLLSGSLYDCSPVNLSENA